MRSATVRANPVPHSKTCDTFRAADRTAVGTGLGSPSFVGLDVTRSVPAGFVFEHVAEHGPAGVEDGLCHPCFRKLGRIHIADDDQFIFTSDHGGPLMQMVAPRVGNIGVDRLGAPLVSGTLCDCKRGLVPSIVPQGGDRRAIAACCERLESEVNSDLTVAGREIVGDVTLKRDIPAPAGILRKTSGLELAAEVTRFPRSEICASDRRRAHRQSAQRAEQTESIQARDWRRDLRETSGSVSLRYAKRQIADRSPAQYRNADQVRSRPRCRA